ncbi:S1/P1 nuclease [Rubrolithibacter danxiaensis]|uniref:S1/P1 nuclease n=1 Tax=Rubrolithibacter danxiaensis TaxID=3390805 RepID=UPI003BF7BE72
MSKSRIILICILLVYIPANTMAWGILGHRIVGGIAESYLSKKTLDEIRKILGNESLAIASNWADFVKSDPAYNYLGRWHYINFDKGLSFTNMNQVLKKDTSVNAYTKLKFLIDELKKKSLPKEKKVLYLRLLIHIVADIHQPFHVGYAEDKGGNNIKVSWFNKRTDMHGLWDSQLIEFQKLSYTEYIQAINHPSQAELNKWQKEGLNKWFFDSYVLAEKLYADVPPNAKLSYRYNYENLATLNSQLLKGGVHLAGLLNEIFGS